MLRMSYLNIEINIVRYLERSLRWTNSSFEHISKKFIYKITYRERGQKVEINGIMSQFLLNPPTGSVFREEVGTNI